MLALLLLLGGLLGLVDLGFHPLTAWAWAPPGATVGPLPAWASIGAIVIGRCLQMIEPDGA